jgi:peptidoglycan/LPS O-acetylase OafA/YrhL
LVRWGFSALLAAGLIRWLPAGLLAAGAIWLLGVLGFFIVQWSWLWGLLDRRISAAIAAVFLGFVLLASRLGWTVGSDGWVGTACLLVIVTWADVGPGPRWWARLTTGLSQISYTLYLVHFPLLAFGFFGWARGVRLQPGLEGYTLGVAVLALCLAFAVGFWWCFERNTDALRAAVLRHGPRWLSPAGKAQAG